MRHYDDLKPVLHPYLIANSAPNVRTTVVSTDGEGFRRTPNEHGSVDQEVALVLGGSFVFGVGASRDDATLPSVLSRTCDVGVRNLGIRAGNSTQEMIAALPFFSKARSVLVASGANNLIAALQSTGTNEEFGPFFFEGEYQKLRGLPLHELTRRVQRIGRPRLATRSVQRRPPKGSSELYRAAEAALTRQTRDLRSVVALAGPDVQVFFAVQPFRFEPSTGTPEEALFALHDRMQGAAWKGVLDFARQVWPGYVSRLKERAAGLGCARIVDLNEISFSGWSFLDRVHPNDKGYEQAAAHILDKGTQL